jgi:DNA-binding Lrp family transcriptional regulator
LTAAEALGLSPTALWRKLKKLDIDNPHRRR